MGSLETYITIVVVLWASGTDNAQLDSGAMSSDVAYAVQEGADAGTCYWVQPREVQHLHSLSRQARVTAATFCYGRHCRRGYERDISSTLLSVSWL